MRPGRWVSAIPLRIVLAFAMVALSGLVLLASGFAVTQALSNSLDRRTDEQLYESADTWAKPRPVKNAGGAASTLADRPTPTPSPGEQPYLFFELRKSAEGQVFLNRTVPNLSPPEPSALPALGTATISSVDGATPWRVLTVVNRFGSSTIGLPLTANRRTVSRLVAFEIITGASALVLLAVGGYAVVRRSLRPLRRVEETAAAIAAGDLNQRLPVHDVDTEVDNLARSFNVMLGRIQHGVSAIEASEENARRSETKMRQFVADAGHELRTPLTTIRGFAELYRQGASPDPAPAMTRIEAEAGRMALLVEDLLTLARLDARRAIARQPVDLLSITSEVIHDTRALSAKDGEPTHRVRLVVCDGVGTLETIGDGTRLRQVLQHLIVNAVTHTPPGTPVTVRLTPTATAIHIEVIDSGPGLPPEAAARVFERFYRTDASRTRASGGTGLGLSIVQASVVAHNGFVSVTSEPGQGATFTVVLPRGGGSASTQT
ncbi:sensor histidine kinase [Nocardia sp. NPDC020380]|uniref:sensor histidine kinase n=1 Tax=Nocardia sp. NPDC020380 TaxID=3364309 RepID=UPI0037B1090B